MLTDKNPGMGAWSRGSMPKFDPGEKVLAAEAKRQDLRAKTPVLSPGRHVYLALRPASTGYQ